MFSIIVGLARLNQFARYSLSIYIFIYLSTYIYIYIYLSIYIHMYKYISICLSIHLYTICIQLQSVLFIARSANVSYNS